MEICAGFVLLSINGMGLCPANFALQSADIQGLHPDDVLSYWFCQYAH
ncbi:hypothetical protein EHW99_2504 [Erwinia amylovora]|uniref:Uncharacterized protein n=3 Tax=Erwinia amylovora TaxID=552 RepID=A0A830ZXP9_ERWAM|nr:hypothetical protein EaACW_1084 [Erwinia amylovora ACW56400]QJQ55206.1 hypothetical protein EHX00_2504 [Erwinia amylovora]CBA20026.1 hypothetical protein predicted by Glimmer/Critica [Erwinia amylovora CFBP1430]CBX79925.1 hypothetical protein predicted by Glimmer/Critica [Erwinia amylovora ATCC BAA-2158]CCO77929.1 hypothetical protein BN432_1109 [Erwinia amylovora Ea356]CCO81716.1 hypothetical protein BN433_1123 [Erwinia amylovora Ea266]CCO85520.1 hypothetical protein BN434_1110 [Erwinia a